MQTTQPSTSVTERDLSHGDPVVLGACANAHLGDTLCISPVPRALNQRGVQVYVQDYPNARAVFANNSFVAGFRKDGEMPLLWLARGKGHVIQQVFQGLGLPMEPVPKPQVYLDTCELAWAAAQRKIWSSDRPVCVLSTGAITDAVNVSRVDWTSVVRVLSRHCTVIQAVSREDPVPGAMVYRDLTTREYMALISAADLFVGGTSGGSHVAAAFDVPSLIVIWESLHLNLKFPLSSKDVKASFLYPQHWFVSAENLEPYTFNEPTLEDSLAELLKDGRAGRPTALGQNARHPCGFAPQPPPRVMRPAGRRLIPLPVKYGEKCLAC